MPDERAQAGGGQQGDRHRPLALWLNFAKFLLGTVALGLVSTAVSREMQHREIELKEQEQIGQFLTHALQENVGVRHRFAQYFATVTRSEELRRRWQEYSRLVDAEMTQLGERRDRLQGAAEKTADVEKRERLFGEIAQIDTELSPRPATAEAVPPRVYLHIRENAQRERARRLELALETGGFVVPGIERLDVGPDATEVRYFRAAERAEAESIAALLAREDVASRVRYVAGHETSSRIRARHFELWLAPGVS